LPASEDKLLPSPQVDLEWEAAARAVEDAKEMAARPSFQDADAAVLDVRDDLAVELQLPIRQTSRTPQLSADTETPDERHRGTAPVREEPRVVSRESGCRMYAAHLLGVLIDSHAVLSVFKRCSASRSPACRSG
jgi:hypothetical protein